MIESYTLQIMIACRYFEFTAERYKKLAAISLDFAEDFITQNQAEFMSVENDITMSDDLFERLISSEHIHKEYKDKLFAEYAESHMTKKVARNMDTLKLPITKDIVDVAMECVDQEEQAKILRENCGVYDAEELQQKFSELEEQQKTF